MFLLILYVGLSSHVYTTFAKPDPRIGSEIKQNILFRASEDAIQLLPVVIVR